MRKEISRVLKQVFRARLIIERDRLNLTQSEMANILCMDIRSYADLEHGISGCSAVTLMLYLICICDDVDRFLKEMKERIGNTDENVA